MGMVTELCKVIKRRVDVLGMGHRHQGLLLGIGYEGHPTLRTWVRCQGENQPFFVNDSNRGQVLGCPRV